MASPSGPATVSVEEVERRAEEAGADYEVGLESLSQWQLAWRKFRKHRLAIVGSGILLVLVVVAIDRADPLAVRLQRDPQAEHVVVRRAGRRRSPIRSARPAASSATSSRSSSTARGRRS